MTTSPDAAPRGLAPTLALDLTRPNSASLLVGGSGVVIGCDPQGRAVQLEVVRVAPSRLVLLGGSYLARQLVLRCAATGVSVVVSTSRPATWESLVRATTPGRSTDRERIAVRGPQPGPLPTPSADDPFLVVYDGPFTSVPPPGPWQTSVHLLASSDLGHLEGTAHDDEVVLARRMPWLQANLATDRWSVPPARAVELTSIPVDGAVVFGAQLWQPLRLVTTPLEAALLGPLYD